MIRFAVLFIFLSGAFSSSLEAQSLKQILSCSIWVKPNLVEEEIYAKKENDIAFVIDELELGEKQSKSVEVTSDAFENAPFNGKIVINFEVYSLKVLNTIFKPVDYYHFAELEHQNLNSEGEWTSLASAESFSSLYSPLMLRINSPEPSLQQAGLTCMHFYID